MNKAKAYYVISMLIFGSIGIFTRNINLSSGEIAIVRGIIGSIFLLAACPLLKQRVSFKAVRRNLWLLVLSGAAIGFNWVLLFQAYKYTTISNATLSYYFAPVIVMFLTPFILKERLTLIRSLCILGAFLGMFLVIGNGGGMNQSHLMGIGYGLSAAILYASVVLMNKFVKGLSGIETTLIQLSSATLVLLPFILLTEEVGFFRANAISLALLITVGVIHTGLAYLLYFTAIRRLSGQTIALFSYLDPISAILMSSIIFHESMTVLQVIGGLLILGATLVSELYDRKRSIQE